MKISKFIKDDFLYVLAILAIEKRHQITRTKILNNYPTHNINPKLLGFFSISSLSFLKFRNIYNFH